jgi:hypothetical protein
MSGQRDGAGASGGRRRRPPAGVVVAGVAVVGLLGVGALALFQPWKLVVNETVDEAAPGLALGSSTAAGGLGAPSASSSVPATSSSSSGSTGISVAPVGSPRPSVVSASGSAGPVRLAVGSFVSHEHATSGRAVVLRLADGSRVLRLEGLDTSNGPDLHVWLSDQRVVDGPSGWTVFDDGAYVDLGSLKGNRGNQNYAIPAGADLRRLSSVSVWCARFKVSFGAAALVATGTP